VENVHAYITSSNPSRLILQSWCPFVLVVILCVWHVLVKPFPTLVIYGAKFCAKEVRSVLSATRCVLSAARCVLHAEISPLLCNCVFCGCSEMCQQTVAYPGILFEGRVEPPNTPPPPFGTPLSTDDLRASHAVFPVVSGKVKDKVVPVKSVELIRLGTYL
jgi:hypothetical protein